MPPKTNLDIYSFFHADKNIFVLEKYIIILYIDPQFSRNGKKNNIIATVNI